MPHTAVASTCLCAWTLGGPEAGLVALIRARSLPRCCSLLKRASLEDGEADVGQLGLELFQARVDVAAARPSFVLATGATQRAAPVQRSGERSCARRCDLEAVSSRSWTWSIGIFSAGSPAFAGRAAATKCWVIASRWAPRRVVTEEMLRPGQFPVIASHFLPSRVSARVRPTSCARTTVAAAPARCGCVGNGSTSCCRRAQRAAPLPATLPARPPPGSCLPPDRSRKRVPGHSQYSTPRQRGAKYH